MLLKFPPTRILPSGNATIEEMDGPGHLLPSIPGKGTAYENLLIGQHLDGVYRPGDVAAEGGVDDSVGINAGEVANAMALQPFPQSAQEDFPILLNRRSGHKEINRFGIEGVIGPAIRVKSRQDFARDPLPIDEPSAHRDELAIRLQCAWFNFFKIALAWTTSGQSISIR
jgi:hypothetical protein